MNEVPSLHTPEGNAHIQLQHCWQMAHRMGANDYETGAIEQIIADMKAGKISPDEALRQAQAILDAKNDR